MGLSHYTTRPSFSGFLRCHNQRYLVEYSYCESVFDNPISLYIRATKIKI